MWRENLPGLPLCLPNCLYEMYVNFNEPCEGHLFLKSFIKFTDHNFVKDTVSSKNSIVRLIYCFLTQRLQVVN